MSLKAQQIRMLIRAGVLEMKRRNDFQILCLLMGVYLFMALGIRVVGEQTLEAHAFMLNLGLTLSSFFGVLLAALTGLRQIAEDIEQRSIYPLLSRPLERQTLLAGRFLTAASSGMLVATGFFALTLIVCPIPSTMQVDMLLQFLLFQPLTISWAAAFALMFGLWLPQLLAALLSLTLIFGGELLFRFLPDVFFPKLILPRFGSLQLTNRVTGGLEPLGSTDWLPLLLYGLGWLAFCHVTSSALFRRRAL